MRFMANPSTVRASMISSSSFIIMTSFIVLHLGQNRSIPLRTIENVGDESRLAPADPTLTSSAVVLDTNCKTQYASCGWYASISGVPCSGMSTCEWQCGVCVCVCVSVCVVG
jgi:hypothetical protein